MSGKNFSFLKDWQEVFYGSWLVAQEPRRSGIMVTEENLPVRLLSISIPRFVLMIPIFATRPEN